MAPQRDRLAIAQKILMELIEYRRIDAEEVEYLRGTLPPQEGRPLSAHQLACAVINKALTDRAKASGT
jgi:hypothetical protein